MQNMTIEQLHAASNAGEVLGVTLKEHGGAFLVQIATRIRTCSLRFSVLRFDRGRP